MTKAKFRSEDFAGSEILHELQVGLEKVEGGEFLALGPLHIAKDAVFDFAFEFMDGVEA